MVDECAAGGSPKELRWSSRHYPTMHLLAIFVVGSLLIGVSALQAMAAPLPLIDSTSTEEVPLFSSEEAWQLAQVPQSRMIDEVTCERIEDACLVSSEKFPAILSGSIADANQVSHRFDERTKRYAYGRSFDSVC